VLQENKDIHLGRSEDTALQRATYDRSYMTLLIRRYCRLSFKCNWFKSLIEGARRASGITFIRCVPCQKIGEPNYLKAFGSKINMLAKTVLKSL